MVKRRAGQASQLPKRYKSSSGSLIPHEILINIISRLPAKAVLQWRCVSKIWRDLTSTLDFVRLHIAHTNPTILIEHHSTHQHVFDENRVEYDYRINQLFVDRWWKPEQKKSVIYRFPNCPDFQYSTKISQGGLIVMESPESDFIVFNPVFRERVRLIVNLETIFCRRIDVYGIFWHPNLKEYCIMLVIIGYNLGSQYNILNLGCKPLLREITCPHKVDGSLCDPVLVDQHLYRMVRIPWEHDRMKSILEFDIITEEFTIISCPSEVSECMHWQESHINILSINGLLSIVQISWSSVYSSRNPIVINIWTLKDREKQMWTRSEHWFRCEVKPDSYTKALTLVNEKLLVCRTYDRLFLCDLGKGKAKYIGKKSYDHRCRFMSHVISLVSLRNCQSEIQIG